MSPDVKQTARQLKLWARELGFQDAAITTRALDADERHLLSWLADGYHGEMAYMASHGTRRSRPADLIPGTLSVISARMDYLPPQARPAGEVLADPSRAYVARYALGRDYHKVMRARLKRLAQRLAHDIGEFGYRVFTDSAPVLEKALARNAGLGWIGKNTLLLHRRAGSYFFLGEIYTDLALPADETPAPQDLCGSCSACLGACPTRAIVAPYRLDARRCISYLTIELKGAIPLPLRPLVGNRVFGCDDCQIACPWNRYAQVSAEPDFRVRHGLDGPRLVACLGWSEAEFLSRTEGMAIRRAGYEGWLRNVAVALGNAPPSKDIERALRQRADHPSEMVREHVAWALARQGQRSGTPTPTGGNG